jgi:hypothetical protein
VRILNFKPEIKTKNENSNHKLRAGNIQSIMFAIERLGFKAVLSNMMKLKQQTK